MSNEKVYKRVFTNSSRVVDSSHSDKLHACQGSVTAVEGRTAGEYGKVTPDGCATSNGFEFNTPKQVDALSGRGVNENYPLIDHKAEMQKVFEESNTDCDSNTGANHCNDDINKVGKQVD